MSILRIKQDLLDLVGDHLEADAVTFDFATALEAEKAAVIKNINVIYSSDLEVHPQKTLRFNLILIAKNATDLDALIDSAEGLNDATSDTGCVKYLVIESMEYADTEDENNKYANFTISATIWDMLE